MFTSKLITSDCDKYELSVLNNDVYLTLEIRIPGQKIRIWDNDEYLLNTVYPRLIENKKEYKKLKPIPREDYPELLEMFNKAIELGFFTNVKLT